MRKREKNAVLVSDFDLFVGGGAEISTLERGEVSWRSYLEKTGSPVLGVLTLATCRINY